MHQMASEFDAEMNALMNFYYPYIHSIHTLAFIDFESNSSRNFFLQLLHCRRIKYMSNIMRLTGFKLASYIFSFLFQPIPHITLFHSTLCISRMHQ